MEANGGATKVGNDNSQSLQYLLGGAGVLQVILTAVGVTSGGISALVINARWLVIAGFSAVVAGIFIGALVLAFKPPKPSTLEKIIIGAGMVFLFAGLWVTAYAALVAPAVAKVPSINVALSQSSGQLLLTAHVKASGIPENDQYWFEVDAREYKKEGSGGKYDALGTPIYQNQLGADSQGDIDSIVTMPLPPGNYPAVSVEAWNGPHAGPCGSLENEGGARLAQGPKNSKATIKEQSREGCVVLRLPASTTTSKTSKKKKKKKKK